MRSKKFSRAVHKAGLHEHKTVQSGQKNQKENTIMEKEMNMEMEDKSTVESKLEVAKNLTPKRNILVARMLTEDWSLGPVKTSIYPDDNKVFWNGIARSWQIEPIEARRRLCSNCEYYNNTPAFIEAMEHIPINAFDKDGDGRGFCFEFDFICHSLRTCRAWEEKEFIEED